MMKKIIINVDDLGFSHAVNHAVVHLAEKQRIHATSFMSCGQISVDHLHVLQKMGIDVGLHLDFTGMAGQGNLKTVLWKSYTRQFSIEKLMDLIDQQLTQFEDKIGAIPHFVDGHQHVHQFPQIRNALLNCLERRYAHKIPIRNTKTYQTDLKAKLIYCLGGNVLKQQLEQRQWPHNRWFAGIYDFQADLQGLGLLWDAWLRQAPHESVIMCHPARQDEKWQDEIYAARMLEYQWLLSDEFLALWQKYQCQGSSWQAFNPDAVGAE